MKKILLCLVVILLLLIPAAAQGSDEPEDMSELLEPIYEQLNISAFDDSAESFSELFGYESASELLSALLAGEAELSAAELVQNVVKLLFSELREISSGLLRLIILCVISALLGELSGSFIGKEVKSMVRLACAAACALTLSSIFSSAIAYMQSGSGDLLQFLNIAATALLVLLTAGGGSIAAGLLHPMLLSCCNVCTYIINGVIIPAAQLFFVLSVADKLSEAINLAPLAKLVKKFGSMALGAGLTLCTALIALSGSSFAKLDGAGAKTIKYAISNLVPFVGSFLSGSLETVAGYMGLIRSQIGLLGCLVILAIVISPVLKLLALTLSLKLTAALCAPFAESSVSSLIETASECMGFILACLLAQSVMCIVIVAILMNLAVPLLV